MKLYEVLQKYDFPPEHIAMFEQTGIVDLYPPQAECIKKGLLDRKNMLVSVPTAAGKTLMAELCMLRSLLLKKGRGLYIAPLKALASEKYNDFKKRFTPLGISVGIAVGDHDSSEGDIKNADIIIATAEKVDSLLRSKATWLIDCLGVVVIDEIHFINDGSRGPTLEILTARIRQLNPKIQFLGLSATVSNAKDMAKWLNAELVSSNWRPVPLKEGVYFHEEIQFKDHGTRVIDNTGDDDVSKITVDTLRRGGQVLIFVNSRRSAQAVAREISSHVSKHISHEERELLKHLSEKIIGNKAESTKLCQKLADAVIHGSAFHHAGLKPNQRELVENNFKNNIIKVISCTPTLAAGVNLPAQRAIIRDVKRFELGLGSAFIPVSEYKQCAGRAGRPQYDDFGEAVIVAKSHSEASTLMERFVEGQTEPITSKLNEESALRTHILASIAGGYIYDIQGMFEFISHTFLYHQNPTKALLDKIENIFAFLTKEGFIQVSGKRYFATPLGALTSRLYIDPFSAITLRSALKKLKPDDTISSIGMLHALCCCPDGPLTQNVGKKIAEDLNMFISQFQKDFILTPSNWPDLEDFFYYLGTMKATWLLTHWIEEEKEDYICEFFDMGPGDIYRLVEAAQRLLYAAQSIAHLEHLKNFTFQLENLKNRIHYGIKEELLDIIKLRGVGRVRARAMFGHGIKSIADLKYLSVNELASIKAIGKTLAQDIINQVHTK
ncbi:MAG: DEAD/DEAH box helicase [Candidatus Omnitrophica bacterium]|nr:DEAD/DEAH box helicase [Candidatus Omnitrophota bacterium]